MEEAKHAAASAAAAPSVPQSGQLNLSGAWASRPAVPKAGPGAGKVTAASAGSTVAPKTAASGAGAGELFWDYEAPVAPSEPLPKSTAKAVAAASVVKASAHLGPPPASTTAAAKLVKVVKAAPVQTTVVATVASGPTSSGADSDAVSTSTVGNEFGGGAMSGDLAAYVSVWFLHSM